MSEPAWVAMGAAGLDPTPPGAIAYHAGSAIPGGYLLCDGRVISRTTYAALFAAISTAYGGGDGSTTFGIPDLQGRAAVGKGTHAAVDVLGDNDGAALANRQPGHRHTVTDPGHVHNLLGNNDKNYSQNLTKQALNAGNLGSGSVIGAATGVSVATAGASAPLDTPAYLVLNPIIKT